MTDMQAITTHPAETVEAGQLESLTLHARILEFAHETGVFFALFNPPLLCAFRRTNCEQWPLQRTRQQPSR